MGACGVLEFIAVTLAMTFAVAAFVIVALAFRAVDDVVFAAALLAVTGIVVVGFSRDVSSCRKYNCGV